MAGDGMYSYLPRVPELPKWGGLKAADSVFTLRLALTVGPKGTYCNSYCLSVLQVSAKGTHMVEVISGFHRYDSLVLMLHAPVCNPVCNCRQTLQVQPLGQHTVCRPFVLEHLPALAMHK